MFWLSFFFFFWFFSICFDGGRLGIVVIVVSSSSTVVAIAIALSSIPLIALYSTSSFCVPISLFTTSSSSPHLLLFSSPQLQISSSQLDPNLLLHTVIVEVPRWTNAKMEISKEEPLNPILQGEFWGIEWGCQRMLRTVGRLWEDQ